MAQKNKLIKDKQIYVRGGLHRKLKSLCFENDLKIHDLVNAILSFMLDDQNKPKLSEIIAGLDTESD